MMQSFYVFSSFWLAYVFYILSIQGTDVNELKSDHPFLYNETDETTLKLMFKEFVRTHNKTYVNDPEEYIKRLGVFKESLARHSKLNAREAELNGTAVYGINQFSDWTPEEFREFLRRGSREDHGLFTNTCSLPPTDYCKLKLNASATPHNHDWRKEEKVTAVKNQGKCGSCWAFTATECIESQWAIAGNPVTELSVQELISCSRPKGCSGGSTLGALDWLSTYQYTLAPATEFPYVDKETTCKTNLLKEKGVKIKCGCPVLIKTESTRMKELVGLHGPLAVNVDATMWHDYLGGIIQHHCTDTDINHAVQITGYDFNGNIWYWIVRNSWGPSYGDNGYLYIKMGDNLCGVANSPSYVVI
ncbi:hypothetical protein ACROYT_G018462 [Oculina patagonica]